MTSLQTVTAFFGWTTVINFVFLAVTTIAVVALRGFITRLHAKMFGLDPEDVVRDYFRYIAQYKIAIIIFSLVPYIALRLMS